MTGSFLNKVILIGNLGADPEVRTLASGKRVASFNLATTEVWYNKTSGNNERNEKTEWHKVVIFVTPLVDITEKYLRKGSKVYLEGSIHKREWVENNGTTSDSSGYKRYITEVILQSFSSTLIILDSRNNNRGDMHNSSHNSSQNGFNGNDGGFSGSHHFDGDDIPF